MKSQTSVMIFEGELRPEEPASDTLELRRLAPGRRWNARKARAMSYAVPKATHALLAAVTCQMTFSIVFLERSYGVALVQMMLAMQ